MEETNASSVRFIIQVLHEEQQWDEISRLFLSNLSSNMNHCINVDPTKRSSQIDQLSSFWNQELTPDNIWMLWNRWNTLATNHHHPNKDGTHKSLTEDELFEKLLDLFKHPSQKINTNLNQTHFNSPTIVKLETKQPETKKEAIYGNHPTNILQREACTSDFHPLGPMGTNSVINNNDESMYHSSNASRDRNIETQPFLKHDSYSSSLQDTDNNTTNTTHYYNPSSQTVRSKQNPMKTDNKNPFDQIMKKSQEIDYEDVTNRITNAALWVQHNVSEHPLLNSDMENSKPKSMELKELSELPSEKQSSSHEQSRNTIDTTAPSSHLSTNQIKKKKEMEDILNYTSTARKSTETVKEWTLNASHGVKNAATHGIMNLANQWEEHKIGEKIIPSEKHRVLVSNVGKVGLAGLGATAVVTEAIIVGTLKAAEKGVEVTANAVREKCGEEAGQVVEDTGKTITNVFQTVRLASTTLTVNGITRSVARNTAKKYSMPDSSSLQPSISDHDDSDTEHGDSDSEDSSMESSKEGDIGTQKKNKSDLDMLIESSVDFDSDDEDYHTDLSKTHDNGHLKQE